MRSRCRCRSRTSTPTASSPPASFPARGRWTTASSCSTTRAWLPDGTQNPDFPLNRPAWQPARIVVAGRNFACGSSRESAVWALFDAGFRCAIAPSFGDIFRSNGTKNGLLPVVLPAEAVESIIVQLEAEPGAHVAVDLPLQTVTAPDGTVHPFEIDPFAKHCLLQGLDDFGLTATYEDEIAAFERRYGRENKP